MPPSRVLQQSSRCDSLPNGGLFDRILDVFVGCLLQPLVQLTVRSQHKQERHAPSTLSAPSHPALLHSVGQLLVYHGLRNAQPAEEITLSLLLTQPAPVVHQMARILPTLPQKLVEKLSLLLWNLGSNCTVTDTTNP